METPIFDRRPFEQLLTQRRAAWNAFQNTRVSPPGPLQHLFS